MTLRPARHDLLRITPVGWSALFGAEPALAALGGMRWWCERDLPVMARRPRPGDAADALAVCIALPPCHGGARLPFCLPRASVAELLAPVCPADLLPAVSLPASWRRRLRAVSALADRMSLRPRLFGSLLWQHVTGLPYLREGSDLDLFWHFAAGEADRIETLLSALSALDGAPGPRLDGEIHVAGRGAVSWRELALGCRELLLRTDADVRLVSRAGFLDRIAPAC